MPAHQARQRAGGEADELAVQHLKAGQAGDRVEAVGVKRRAVHDPALVLEDVVLLGEVRDRLGGGDRVALDERQRGRADEQVVEAIRAGVGGGALGEAVLDDAEDRVGLGSFWRSSAACGTLIPR